MTGVQTCALPISIVRNEQDALNLALAMDRAGLPVNIRVPAPGAAPGGANALPGASAPNVNALGANVPLPGETPRQALERFQSDLRRGEAAEKSERDRVAALERQGFRSLSGGRQERIPGGPADPEALAAQEEGKNLAKLRTEEYKELGKNAAAARKARAPAGRPGLSHTQPQTRRGRDLLNRGALRRVARRVLRLQHAGLLGRDHRRVHRHLVGAAILEHHDALRSVLLA